MIATKPPFRFVLHKLGDATRPFVLANIHRAIDTLDSSKAWRLTIDEDKPARTSAANAYLWGVVYTSLVRELGFKAEEWHEEMCIRHFGGVVVEKPCGRTEAKPLRTTTTNEQGKRDVLKGSAFWQFVEHVRRVGAEGGVYIPEPNETERSEIEREFKRAA